jgi:glycosyltransferase involved in cell wall biosynthesis
MTPTHVQIVLPLYNPPAGWPTALAARYAQLRIILLRHVDEVGITIVNDGSSQGCSPADLAAAQDLIPSLQAISYTENRGKGYALRQGIAASEAATFWLVTDADFPYTMESMERIVLTLKSDGGIAAGNRDMAYYAHVPRFRRWLSKSLRWMLRHLLRLQVTDSQCGLKGFDRAGRSVFLETKIDRFLFDLEFLLTAKGRVQVTPVPAELRSGVIFSKVGWKVLATEGRNFLSLVLKQWF